MATVLEVDTTAELVRDTWSPDAAKRDDRSVRKLRVCHLSVGLTTGGLERLLVEFARHHDRSRFELTFAALHGGGQPADEIRAAGCAVHLLGCQRLRPWTRVAQIAELFRQLSIDVVHTHNEAPHLWGTAAARWARVPVVLQTRHGQGIGNGAWASLRYRLMTHWADRIVAVSDDAARMCSTTDRLPRAKVMRIWNGIDCSRFSYRGTAEDEDFRDEKTRSQATPAMGSLRSTATTKDPAATRGPTAISVARLSPEKDFATLLRATARVVNVVPEFRLQIAGDGKERPALERLAHELNLSEHVQFLGERRDIPDLLAQAGFFVSSSLTEGVSLTLLEAMAVGLPVLATSVGGNLEVVEDGVTGRLVPAGDPVVLAEGIVQMCKDSAAWPRMGRYGRRRVEQHFEVRRMLRDYESLYAELWRGR